MNLSTKQKRDCDCDSQTCEPSYGYQRGEGSGRVNWEFGINRYKLLYIEQTARSSCGTQDTRTYL